MMWSQVIIWSKVKFICIYDHNNYIEYVKKGNDDIVPQVVHCDLEKLPGEPGFERRSFAR